MASDLVVSDTPIAPGEHAVVRVPVARLPTGTLIELQVHAYRGEEHGPVLLVQGGLHGDEVGGIETCRRLLDRGLAVPRRGAVLVVPVLNVFGFLHFSRVVPDGKDVNRSFPGSARGSLARRTAHAYMTHVFPAATHAIDLHTGGDQRHNHPQARYTEHLPESRALAEAMAPPLRFGAKLIPKSFRQAAADRAVPVVVYEGGETMRIDHEPVEEGVRCIRRVMRHLGLVDDAPEAAESVHLADSRWLRAPRAGLWRPYVGPGEWVEQGTCLGKVTDPYATEHDLLHAARDGWIASLNHQAVVTAGDALIRLGWT
jgi:predicted deacylase